MLNKLNIKKFKNSKKKTPSTRRHDVFSNLSEVTCLKKRWLPINYLIKFITKTYRRKNCLHQENKEHSSVSLVIQSNVTVYYECAKKGNSQQRRTQSVTVSEDSVWIVELAFN